MDSHVASTMECGKKCRGEHTQKASKHGDKELLLEGSMVKDLDGGTGPGEEDTEGKKTSFTSTSHS